MKGLFAHSTVALTVLSFAAVSCTKSKSSESDPKPEAQQKKQDQNQVPAPVQTAKPSEPVQTSPTVQTQGQTAQVPYDNKQKPVKAVVLPPTNNQIQQQVPAGSTTSQAPSAFKVKFTKSMMGDFGTSITFSSDPDQRAYLPILLENINDAAGVPVLPGGARTKLMGTVYLNDPSASRSIFSVTGFIVDDKTVFNTNASGYFDIEVKKVAPLASSILKIGGSALGVAGVITLIEGVTGDKHIEVKDVLIGAAAGAAAGGLWTLTTRENKAFFPENSVVDVCFGVPCTAK